MIQAPVSVLVLCTTLFLGFTTCGGQFQRKLTTSNRGQSQFGGQYHFGSQSQFQAQPGKEFQSQFGNNRVEQFRNIQAANLKSAVTCPEKNGRFPVPSQCDAYVECIDGVGEEKLCPEGLLFNTNVRFNYPCGYPIDVDCLGRSSLQPAQPTQDCPHQYGYFKVGDQQNCGKFMNCADGVGYVFDCPEGLAYNSETYRCDWPDQVSDCDAEAYLGFSCPSAKEGGYLAGELRFFRSPQDCQRYYVCVNGRPRLQNCGEGNAFNDLINTCDAAENVTGCATEFEQRVPTSFNNGFQEQQPPDRQQQGGAIARSRFGRL